MSNKQENGKLLENKVALVTGGASGFGKRFAMRLAEEGCNIAICDLDEAKGETVAREIQEEFGCKVFFKKADVRIKSEVDSFVKEVVDHFNRIDIAVNNAGIIPGSPFLELTEEEWDRCLDINLKGCFLCTQAVAKAMVENKVKGKIVNISSDSGIVGRPGGAHYGSSKAGVILMSKVAAYEMAEFGIHINCLCPGPVKTEGQIVNFTTEAAKKRYKTRVSKTPFGGREATFDEMANCMIFLVSSQSDFVTGHALVADGGYTAAMEL